MDTNFKIHNEWLKAEQAGGHIELREGIVTTPSPWHESLITKTQHYSAWGPTLSVSTAHTHLPTLTHKQKALFFCRLFSSEAVKCSSETRGIFIIKTVQGVDMHINYFLRTIIYCKYRNIPILWCYQADPTLTLAEAMIYMPQGSILHHTHTAYP